MHGVVFGLGLGCFLGSAFWAKESQKPPRLCAGRGNESNILSQGWGFNSRVWIWHMEDGYVIGSGDLVRLYWTVYVVHRPGSARGGGGMMHYGFCRKHADQTGEGGCPECAMDHQQEEITALRAEVERLQTNLDANWVMHQRVVSAESRVDNLAALVRILVHSLRKVNPNSSNIIRAMDYLTRNGLTGSILRDDEVTP